MNIAEFSGIPRIYSSDSDPTVGAGARRVFGLYFHLARLAAQETLKLGYRNQVRVETTRCPPSSWKDSAAYDCGVCSVFIVVLGGAEGKKRNVRRRSHGTRSLVHKQDAVVKS